MIKKQNLKNKLEPFLYKSLQKDEYAIINKNPNDLLTWNRFDLAFKLFYLDTKDTNYKLAEKVYKEDIKAQTLSTFIEPGNESEKNSFQIYIDSFDKTFNDIKTNGFDENKTLIPLSSDQSIINGSHRVASAIYLEKNIACIATEQDNMIADYRYFYERDVSLDILDLVVKKFIEYANNDTYIAFLWPSSRSAKEEAESKFSNIVYKKEIKLTSTGAFNLLVELYKHMDWVGNKNSGFAGAKQKLIECFPVFESFTVIVFQSESLEKVRRVKKNVRNIFNIGFSSIHITDTKEEAIRVSKLIFNENGLHFLNYANPHQYIDLYDKLDKFSIFLNNNNIQKSEIVIDGSAVLSLYGLRKNADIDYLILDNNRVKNVDMEYELHDNELKHHKQTKSNLIYNNKYYFEYLGFKFTSFQQLYKMKKSRNEEKDVNDCSLMNSLLENNRFNKLKSQIKQTVFYWKIKIYRIFLLGLIGFLKFIKLYVPVRFIYRKLKDIK